MALTVRGGRITSNRTRHSARLIGNSFTDWEVSFLPGRVMDYDDACTAMKIADLAGPELWHSDFQDWIERQRLADTLGMAPRSVVGLVGSKPAWRASERSPSTDSIDYYPKKQRQPRRKATEPVVERDEPEAGG